MRPRLLAAPDSFKGTAGALEAAEAIARGARLEGWEARLCPLSDGGEGFAEVLAGRSSTRIYQRVSGPDGTPVEAFWVRSGDTAIADCASASGLVLAGGPERNDPIGASSRGTGELVVAAIGAGVRRVLLGLGGSASTDGGLGALRAIEDGGGLRGTELLVACDVTTRFSDAARVFAPQKGADRAQVRLLESRLRELACHYRSRYGMDLDAIEGSGAAGGLAGGLACIGARLLPGFDLVADTLDLDGLMDEVDLVVTGEGTLDATSWDGKVVGGVLSRAASRGTPVLVLAGQLRGQPTQTQPTQTQPGPPDTDGARGLSVVELTGAFGEARALNDTAYCIEQATRDFLRSYSPGTREA